MRSALRLQASVLLLAMIMPLAQGHAEEGHAEEGNGGVSMETLHQGMQSLDQELEDFSAERREQLMSDIDGVLSAVDARIVELDSRLEENWDEADQLTRAQAQTALASLRRERARVDEWYQRMEASADFTLESMKEGFHDAFDTLTENWQLAEQKVREAAE